MNGWMGNLLRVNLTTKTSSIESSEKYFKYIGGKGMANRIMYDEVPVGTDPAAPENKIVFAVGPNTGSSAPCSGRITISSLSPFLICIPSFTQLSQGVRACKKRVFPILCLPCNTSTPSQLPSP